MIVFLAVNYGPLIFDITNWWLVHLIFFFSQSIPSRLIRGRWGEKNRETLVLTKFSIKDFSAENWKDGFEAFLRGPEFWCAAQVVKLRSKIDLFEQECRNSQSKNENQKVTVVPFHLNESEQSCFWAFLVIKDSKKEFVAFCRLPIFTAASMKTFKSPKKRKFKK